MDKLGVALCCLTTVEALLFELDRLKFSVLAADGPGPDPDADVEGADGDSSPKAGKLSS